jgi:exopolysaccharide biosynthesis polyprenyl glycosylphosphotransferase
MSAVGLHPNELAWASEAGAGRGGRAARLLPPVAAAALVAGDVAAVLGGFLLAYWARFVAPDAEALALGLEQYAGVGAAVGLLAALLLATHGLYDLDRPPAWPSRLRAITSAVSTALVLTVAASFFLGDERFSRLWFAAGWGLAVAGLMAWRPAAQALYAAARDALAPADRVVIVGANRLGRQVAAELAGARRVVGFVDNGSDLDGGAAAPLLGPIAELERLVHAHAVDEVVVALPEGRRGQVDRLIARGFRRPVEVKVLPNLGEFLPGRVEVHHLGGRPYLGFASAARVSWLKRAGDLVFGALLLAGLAPLLLAVAVAIRLDSRGPIFYRQVRVGKDGRPFRMVKFRSMRADADRLVEQLRARNEASGPLFKIRADPRVTRVGRLLRRTSLDELPQLLNVLRGEMSLVGPRPGLPSEVAEYEDWQHGRLRAVPGMTGLWQVSGRSEVSFHDMVRLDLHYVRTWSPGLDLEILLRTPLAVLSSRGAY